MFLLTYLPKYLLQTCRSKYKLLFIHSERIQWMKISINRTFLIVTTIEGRKLLISRTFLVRQVFKEDNYSREETIRGNTVFE